MHLKVGQSKGRKKPVLTVDELAQYLIVPKRDIVEQLNTARASKGK